DAELVVGVEVVGRRQQADDAREPLLAHPDDLLLAAHLAVVGAVATDALRHRQLVLDDPEEVARDDPLRPLPFHDAPTTPAPAPTTPAPAATSSPTMRIACTCGATSWTRTMRAPAAAATTAAASDASSRSSTAAPPASIPRNHFR